MKLTDEQIDQILERWDKTDAAMQRQIVVAQSTEIMMQQITVARANATIEALREALNRISAEVEKAFDFAVSLNSATSVEDIDELVENRNRT